MGQVAHRVFRRFDVTLVRGAVQERPGAAILGAMPDHPAAAPAWVLVHQLGSVLQTSLISDHRSADGSVEVAQRLATLSIPVPKTLPAVTVAPTLDVEVDEGDVPRLLDGERRDADGEDAFGVEAPTRGLWCTGQWERLFGS